MTKQATGPGALRKNLHVKPGKKITTAELMKALREGSPLVRRQAHEALNFAAARKAKAKATRKR